MRASDHQAACGQSRRLGAPGRQPSKSGHEIPHETCEARARHARARSDNLARTSLPADRRRVMNDERATKTDGGASRWPQPSYSVACAIWLAAGRPRRAAAPGGRRRRPEERLGGAGRQGRRGLVEGACPPKTSVPVRRRSASSSALTRFPLTKVWAKATPEGDAPGRYRVRFYGRVAGADTAPVLCERLLQFGRRGGRLTLVADRTEERLRAAYYLAFQDPVVRSRSHLVVVAERSWEWLIPRPSPATSRHCGWRAGLGSTRRRRSCGTRRSCTCPPRAGRRGTPRHRGPTAGMSPAPSTGRSSSSGSGPSTGSTTRRARCGTSSPTSTPTASATASTSSASSAKAQQWPPRAIETSLRCGQRWRAATTLCP